MQLELFRPSLQYPTHPYGEMLTRTAQRYPEEEALIFKDVNITYRELEALVNAFARALLDLGIRKGQAVCLFMPNRPEYVISWFAATRIGAPVSPINPSYKEREVAYQLNNSDAVAVVVSQELLPLVEAVRSEAPGLKYVITVGSGQGGDQGRDTDPAGSGQGGDKPGPYPVASGQGGDKPGPYPVASGQGGDKPGPYPATMHNDNSFRVGAGLVPALAPMHSFSQLLRTYAAASQIDLGGSEPGWEDVVALPYSSGTTGLPKGVMLSSKNLVCNAYQSVATARITCQDRMLVFVPLYHIYGIMLMGLAALTGATHCADGAFRCRRVFAPDSRAAHHTAVQRAAGAGSAE